MDAAAHRRNGADIAVGRQPALRSLLHFYLHLIGFTASTLLLTWGLFALFFVALGGFSLDGLMHQPNNLTPRYVAAPPARIASFKKIFIAPHFLIAETGRANVETPATNAHPECRFLLKKKNI